MSKYEMIFKLNKSVINVGCFFLSIFRMPLYLKARSDRISNINIKKIPKSKKCYICGLGPSLRQVDFSKIDGDTIVVNHFYKFSSEIEVIPTFYCMTDDAFFSDAFKESFRSALNKYKNTAFILNGKYRHVIEKDYGVLRNIYYSYMWKGSFNSKAKIDYTKRTHIMNNVVCEAISLAIYAGYEEIFLLGCDFNSFATPKSIHCYSEVDNERTISLGFELFCFSFVADTHYELEKYARRNNVQIINATPDSLIDAYLKVALKNGIIKAT